MTMGKVVRRNVTSSWWSGWKLNDALLEHEQLCKTIKRIIQEAKRNHPMNAVQWEQLKEVQELSFKWTAYRYGQEKAARVRAEKRELMQTLSTLIKQENKTSGVFTEDIKDCKRRLLKILEKQYREAMIRCCTLALERDEEPGKVFKTKEQQRSAHSESWIPF
ncbi:unnamed protein product [Ixodes pacificus]